MHPPPKVAAYMAKGGTVYDLEEAELCYGERMHACMRTLVCLLVCHCGQPHALVMWLLAAASRS